MHYDFDDYLSCCKANDRLIFLDIARDRYFQIDRVAERRLLARLGQCPTASDSPKAPDDAWKGGSDGSITRRSFVPPVISILEQPTASPALSPSTLLEVCGCVLRVRHLLAVRGLRSAIDEVLASAKNIAIRTRNDNSEATDAALAFRHARRYVPIAPVCLLDSLALFRFLARRGLRADLVFGVTGAPFSAHCWLQRGDVVLNDTIGNVESYTTIRVI